MIHDNGHVLNNLIQTKHAFFLRLVLEGQAHYIAGNRAAMRILKSNRFQNLAKANGLTVDLDSKAVF